MSAKQKNRLHVEACSLKKGVISDNAWEGGVPLYSHLCIGRFSLNYCELDHRSGTGDVSLGSNQKILGVRQYVMKNKWAKKRVRGAPLLEGE